jgi:excisionase family DNA binding protein
MRALDRRGRDNPTVGTDQHGVGSVAQCSDPIEATIGAGALGIPEVCRLTGFGRTTVYAAIKAGHLVARRYRRRTIVLAEDLRRFLRELPRVEL